MDLRLLIVGCGIVLGACMSAKGGEGMREIVATMTFPDSDVVRVSTTKYDRAGRVEAVLHRVDRPGAAESETASEAYVYDAAGRLHEVRKLDGAGVRWASESYRYDGAGRLLGKALAEPDGFEISRDSYIYAPATGFLAEVRHWTNSGSETRTLLRYDGEARLIADETFLLSREGFPVDREESLERARYLYDPDGRLVEKVAEERPFEGGGRRWAYLYDARGDKTREMAYLRSGGAERLLSTTSYTYAFY